MRLNGVMAILRHLGYESRRCWGDLCREGLPHYRDRADHTRVWAMSEEVDAWDLTRCLPHHVSGDVAEGGPVSTP